MDCQKPSEAKDLAQLALQDNPHPAIVPEFQEVLAKAKEGTIGRMDSPLSTSNANHIEDSLAEETEFEAESEPKNPIISSPKMQ